MRIVRIDLREEFGGVEIIVVRVDHGALQRAVCVKVPEGGFLSALAEAFSALNQWLEEIGCGDRLDPFLVDHGKVIPVAGIGG